MRKQRVGVWLVLASALLLLASSSTTWADPGREKVLDLRTHPAPADHAVIFLTRHGSVGHAVVVVGRRDDAKGLKEAEAFGLFPKDGVLGLETTHVGPVPSDVVRGLLRGGSRMPLVHRLLCQVDEATWFVVEDIRQRWVGKADSGLLEADAEAFLTEVAEAIGLVFREREPGSSLPTHLRAMIEQSNVLPRRTPRALPAAAAPGVDLPELGTLGQAPTGDGVIVLTVTGDGRMSIGDEGPLSLVGLRDVFARLTRDPAWREPDRSSKKVLLVNADASLPWVVGQWIMQVAAEPRVLLYKVFFGARPRGKDEAGAIGWTLPKDRGINGGGFVEEEQHVTVKLFSKAGAAPSDPEVLLPRLRAMRARHGNDDAVVFELKAPGPTGAAVPTGFVLQVVDVARRAGFVTIRFEGAAPPVAGKGTPDDPELVPNLVAKLKALGGTPYIRFGDEHVGAWPTGLAKPAARGRLPTPYGFGLADAAGATLEEAWDEVEELPTVEDFPTPDLEPKPGGVVRDPEVPGRVEPDDVSPPKEAEVVEARPFEGPSNNGLIGIGGGAGGAFRGRGGRRGLEEPGPGRARVAVEDALKWLAAHQSPDGSWDADGFQGWCMGESADTGPEGQGKGLYDPGVSGLALCAFLGGGYTNRGRHPFAKVVGKGLRYLKNVQDEEGCFGPRTTQHFIYNHATAALAMVEAYGMTQSPIFKGSAQRALDFIAIARNPYFVWRYGVKPGDNDTSVTGWMAMTLYAARLINDDAVRRGKPAPLRIDEAAFDGIRNWIDKMTDQETGRAGYIQRGGASARPQDLIDRFPADRTESMTAVAIMARVIVGEDPRTSEVIQKGAALCAAKPPVWNPVSGDIDMYYWYYGTLALHQVGGRTWRAWNAKLVDALTRHQRGDTTYCMYKGSWDPIDPWGPDGGRIYATALLAMCLETPYRYGKAVGGR